MIHSSRLALVAALVGVLSLSLSGAPLARTVLENECLRAEVAPEQGAALKALAVRATGAPVLTAGASAVDALLLPDRTRVSLSNVVFQAGPTASDQAEFTGTLPAFPGLKILKRFRLPAGVAALHIDYELLNTGAVPLDVCLVTQVGLSATGAPVRVAVPTAMGAVTFPETSAVLPLGGSRECYLYDLDGAWAALLDGGGGGMMAAFDPRHLSYLHVEAPSRVFEFGRTVITLAPGKAFRSSGWLMPVQGFTRLNGGAADWAGGFTVAPEEADGTIPLRHLEFSERLVRSATAELKAVAPDNQLRGNKADDDLAELADIVKKSAGQQDDYEGSPLQIRFQVQSARSCQAEAAWSVRPLSGGEWSPLGRESIALQAGSSAGLKQAFKPAKRGSYVVRVDVLEKGKRQASFEQPVVAGTPRGFYRATPPAPEGKVFEAFRPSLWTPSLEVERPHVTLATPLAAGPVRLLMASPYLCSRGLVEIRQRLDAAADYVTAGHQYLMSGETLRAQAGETLKMREFLARPHEVIVLAGVNADFFPIDLVDEILRQVREDGTGLVLVRCGAAQGIFQPLLDAVKGQKTDESVAAAALLPGFPGLVTGTFGKGRVALVDGTIDYAKPDWYGQSEAEVQGLVQSILWTGRGLSELALERPAAELGKQERDSLSAKPYGVTFRNAGAAPFSGILRARVRRDLLRMYPSIYSMGNDFAYRPGAGWEEAVPAQDGLLAVPPGGNGAAEITLPPLAAGNYELDLQVLNSNRSVVAFYCLPLAVTSQARIVSAAFSTEPPGRTLSVRFAGTDRPWFGARAGDTLNVTAEIEDAGAAVRARLQAFDPWGRMPFDQTAAVRKEGGKTVASFVQPLHACLHMISVLRLSLLDAKGGTLSEERLVNFIYPRADRLPAFELRGYAEVRVNNAVSGYDVRTGGGSPLSMAWHGIRKSDYGGVIGGAKILAAGDAVLDKPPELKPTADWAGGGAAKNDTGEKRAGQVEDGLGLGDERIDPKKAYFRIPCFNNPVDRRKILDDMRMSYTLNSSCYPFKGFLTDEFWYAKEEDPKNITSHFRREFVPDRDLNICRCPHCAKAFIAYGRRIFKDDLARLNGAWGTAFMKWEQVEIPLTVSEGTRPPPDAMWPYVLAHRDFIEEQVADLVAEISRTIKAVDPECETGMSGLWKAGIHTGIDIYRLARLVPYNMLYSDIDMWTDFGDSDAVNWSGYGGKYGPFMGSATVWRGLAAGHTGIGYYGKEDDPMHRADFTFFEEPAWLFREVRELKDRGLDKLVVRHRARDPIALYYSSRDVSVAQLEDWAEDAPGFIGGMRNGGRSYSEFVSSVITSYRELCRSRYLQPFWTASAQLEEGDFGGKFGTPRLLLLPYAQCLSPKQADTIRRFVRDGGVLVGDVHTGWRDGNGTVQPRGALDDVFGISRQGDYQMRRRANKAGALIPVRFGNQFGTPFSLAFGAVGAGDVKPVTAKAWASFTLDGREQPAFLVNDFGKGKAIYLNFIPAGYAGVAVSGEGEVQNTQALEGQAAEQFQRFLGTILEIARIRSPLEFTSPQRLTVGRFGEGDVSHLVVMASRSAESILAPYRVKIGEKRHVYSGRLREYLGFTDEFPIRLSVEPRIMGDVYSLLPYKVEGLAVDFPSPAVKAGGRFAFTVKVLPAEAQRHRHVIAVRVVDPGKQDMPWYRFSIETVNGVATGAVDLAASDEPGTWTLELTDAATGVRKTTEFVVLAP